MNAYCKIKIWGNKNSFFALRASPVLRWCKTHHQTVHGTLPVHFVKRQTSNNNIYGRFFISTIGVYHLRTDQRFVWSQRTLQQRQLSRTFCTFAHIHTQAHILVQYTECHHLHHRSHRSRAIPLSRDPQAVVSKYIHTYIHPHRLADCIALHCIALHCVALALQSAHLNASIVPYCTVRPHGL